MFIVYILKSKSHLKKIYIGLTQDIEKRLQEHNSGKEIYSHRHAPWEVETYIIFKEQTLAVQFERYLKSGSGQAFLKRRFLKPL